MSLAQIRERLYRAALLPACSEELGLAAHLLFEGAPAEDQWPDFLDFFVLEWVDAGGFTLLQRMIGQGEVPADCAAWSLEVHTALWVVDGWVENKVLLRDLATEQEWAVEAPGLQQQLPKRMVLRARIVPWQGSWIFSGTPELVEPMGVIARLDLLRQWKEGPEPTLLLRLAELRRLYGQMREEREAWIAYFGSDEVVFDGPEQFGQALSGLVNHLFNVWRFPSLGGKTRAEARREKKGDTPEIVQFQLGGSLAGPGKHGAIYDPVEGIHFFPHYGEFRAHLRGEATHPQILAQYLEDPGIGRLPFQRAGALNGNSSSPNDHLERLLDGRKPPPPRWTVSLLPGIEEER